MTESAGRAEIGRIAGTDWTMKIAVLAGIFLASWLWTGTARASGPPNGADLTSQIQGMVDTQIGTAMGVASSAVSEVAPIAVPAVTVTMSSPETGDPAASEPSVPIVTVDTAPAQAAPVAGLTPKAKVSQHRPRAQPQARGRSTVPRPQLSLATGTGSEGSSASSVELPRISEARRATRRPKPAAPAPRPRLPLAPRAPGDPGALAGGGQGGGQGTSSAPVSATLAGFAFLAILLLLRRAVWSTMPMPRRIALPPWRPG